MMNQNQTRSQIKKGNDNTTKTRLFASKGVLIIEGSSHVRKEVMTRSN